MLVYFIEIGGCWGCGLGLECLKEKNGWKVLWKYLQIIYLTEIHLGVVCHATCNFKHLEILMLAIFSNTIVRVSSNCYKILKLLRYLAHVSILFDLEIFAVYWFHCTSACWIPNKRNYHHYKLMSFKWCIKHHHPLSS